MRHKWILISFVLFAVAGVLLAYPLVSTIINSKYHSDIETAYLGEVIFNMLVLVGLVKGADRVVREMFGM